MATAAEASDKDAEQGVREDEGRGVSADVRHVLRLAEACQDEAVFDPFVQLYNHDGELNPAHLAGPQPFLFYERRALERRAALPVVAGGTDPGKAVARSSSRISKISMKEMRRCFQEIRNLPENSVNPDHVLSNGMTLGNFCLEYVHGPSKVKPSKAVVSKASSSKAAGSKPRGRLPEPEDPGSRASASLVDHDQIRKLSQSENRVQQRLMTSYIKTKGLA